MHRCSSYTEEIVIQRRTHVSNHNLPVQNSVLFIIKTISKKIGTHGMLSGPLILNFMIELIKIQNGRTIWQPKTI